MYKLLLHSSHTLFSPLEWDSRLRNRILNSNPFTPVYGNCPNALCRNCLPFNESSSERWHSSWLRFTTSNKLISWAFKKAQILKGQMDLPFFWEGFKMLFLFFYYCKLEFFDSSHCIWNYLKVGNIFPIENISKYFEFLTEF